MPSSYTSNLRLTLPATGENTGTWGTLVNTGITNLLDSAIAGTANVAMADANYTLTSANGSADEARCMFINLTGALTATRNVVCPSVSKLYFVNNGTTGGQSIVFKTSGGSGITVKNGERAALYCDGTNVVEAFDSTFLQAGTGAVVRSVQDKLRDIVSVKDFGATGDGVTDDTAAIQAAIDYAATIAGTGRYTATCVGVFFPEGDYLTSSSLLINTGGIALYGDSGRGARIFSSQDVIDMVRVGDPTDVNNTWEVHFENLTFSATGLNNSGAIGIKIYRSFLGSVRWCVFNNFYQAISCNRANRWMFHGVRTWQDRDASMAQCSIYLSGTASGSGGGIHMTDCEFAGNPSYAPTVESHILVEECDGLYACNVHTRDCYEGVKVAPTGLLTGNIIDSLFFVNCYFDENYRYNVHLTGEVSGASGRYQFIRFVGCYFRGSGGDSVNCVKIDVQDGGSFGNRVKGISFIGGEMRQASEVAAFVRGSSGGFLEVYGLLFNGIQFESNNFSDASPNSAIQCEAETVTVTGCTFGPDQFVTDRYLQINLSASPSSQPSFVCTGNDFSRANCRETPINYTESTGSTSVQLSDNVFPYTGKAIDQVYRFRSLDNVATNAWSFTVAQGLTGFVEATVTGTTSANTPSMVYKFSTAFRRSGANTILSSGTSNWDAGVAWRSGAAVAVAWNPDSFASPPTADLSANVLRVRVTGYTPVTAGAFTIGQQYVIVSLGTTDFTTIGAASNTVGLTFTATGVGTGSGTAQLASNVIYWAVHIKMTTSY